MPTIEGHFNVDGLPRNGATVKLWSAGAFVTPPVKDTAIPSGSPIASGTTGPTSGGADGAYRFTSVASGEYYVSIEWNGVTVYDYHLIQDGAGLGWTLAQNYANLTLAIAATPSGGTLFIPEGTYTLTSGLTVDKQINIKGGGLGTIIRAGANSLALLTLSSVSGTTLDAITFDNPSGYTGCQGLVLASCARISGRDVVVKQQENGLRINNSSFIDFASSHIDANTSRGVLVSGSTNVSLERMRWSQAAPAYDIEFAGSWSVGKVDGIARLKATSGSHLLITNFRPSSGAALETSGTTHVFCPTNVGTCNIKDYGAVGDGATDDINAFDFAIAAAKLMGTTNKGGTVIVPDGRFAISRPIVLPRTGATPTNVVHLVGHNIRTSTILGLASFPAGSGMVMWEETVARAWHQRIENLSFALPNVSGTTAIHFLPRVIASGTDTSSNLLTETFQIDLKNLLLEGNCDYHTRLIYLQGNIKHCNIEDIYGDCAPGALNQDTIVLETSSGDYGVLFGGNDVAGIHYSCIRRLYGGLRRGGHHGVFRGRLHFCDVESCHTVNGAVDLPAYDFINCSACTIRSLENEGRGEKPQIRFTNSRQIELFNCGTGTPNDAGAGVGNGIELTGICEDIVWNGHARTHGNATYAASSVKNVVVASGCTRCQFLNFDIVGHVSGEVEFTAGPSGTNAVITTTNTDLVLDGWTASSGDVGLCLQLLSGSGFTAGLYRVVSVQSGNRLRLDRSPGSVGTSGGVWQLGGPNYGEFTDINSNRKYFLGYREVGRSKFGDGLWNGEHLILGNYRLWVDSAGDLRIVSGIPSGDTDGTVVGAQS